MKRTHLALLLIVATITTTLAQPSDTYQPTATSGELLNVPNGQFPRWITAPQGQSLLTWIVRTDSSVALLCQRFSTNHQPSGAPMRIALPPTAAAHGEDVPKLAINGNGAWMVVFNLPKPTAENIRAGNLMSRFSTDEGRTWTTDRIVHRDTLPGKSHSYADLTRLPNGEIGLVWLDDKLRGREGRSVRFTQTLPGGGFGPEMIVDSNACQCCRTGILTDSRGRIYLTYRDWLPGNVRDVSYVVSDNNGQSFTSPQGVGRDNWVINGCPHAGPQLYADGEAVFATWFSGATKSEGIRVARLGASEPMLDRISGAVKHPQLTGWADGRRALVWETLVGEGPDAYRQLWLRTYPPTGPSQTVALTPASGLASHPVLQPTANGLLVAWQVWHGAATSLIVKHFPFSFFNQNN